MKAGRRPIAPQQSNKNWLAKAAAVALAKCDDAGFNAIKAQFARQDPNCPLLLYAAARSEASESLSWLTTYANRHPDTRVTLQATVAIALKGKLAQRNFARSQESSLYRLQTQVKTFKRYAESPCRRTDRCVSTHYVCCGRMPSNCLTIDGLRQLLNLFRHDCQTQRMTFDNVL
jgi:hypothetical protein